MDDNDSDSTLSLYEESEIDEPDLNQTFDANVWLNSCPDIIKAVIMDDTYRVQAMLQQGNVVNLRDNQNNTALHMSLNQNMNIIDLLLSHPDVDLECRNNVGETPLMKSIRVSSVAVIMKLLEAGCDVNTQDNIGMNTLNMAFNYKIPIVEELLKRGANLDAPCEWCNGGSALFHAIKISSLELLCMLLHYGADTSITNNNNITPFLYSLLIDSLIDRAIAYELLPYVVDFSLSNPEGLNCLSMAIKSHNPIAADILQVIDYESLNQVDFEGNNALFYSLMYRDGILFKELFSRIDHNILLRSHTPLLYSMLTANIFNDPSWIECFYLFANSDIFAISMQDLLSYLNDRPLFVLITDEFNFEEVPQDDREKIIYIFLSYGVKVYFEDIINYYNVFGPCEELNILTSFKIYGQQPLTCSPFLSYIFGQEVRKSYTDLQRDLIDEIAEYTNSENIVNILRFFTFPLTNENLCLECEINHSNNNFQRPSLFELCRNEIRFIVRNYFGITTTNEFYEAVKRLNKIPGDIKKVILFKTPLH